MIRISKLTMDFTSRGRPLRVLEGVDLEIPSGSGKSTLLGLIAGLDRPSSGTIEIGGVALGDMTEDQLAGFRSGRGGPKIGMIFQAFHASKRRLGRAEGKGFIHFISICRNEEGGYNTRRLLRR